MPRSRTDIYIRLATNTVMILPYVAILLNPQQASPWWAIPMLIWGGWAFRWFANANRLGAITVPVKPWQFLMTSIFGSIVFAGFGIVVIPILIVADIFHLSSTP